MKRVLFVDDEPEVLRGLELSMGLVADDWEMEFATSGAQALDMMSAARSDAVVTDMRMPNMSGGALIETLHTEYPEVARIVLSGQSSREATFHTVHPMHLYLAKPCEADTLQSAIQRALTLQELLNDSHLKQLAGQLNNLPSRPELYDRITQAMASPDVSIRDVGDILADDVAMSAKILQLANSAQYGLRREVSDIAQAATVLGLEAIRDFVLAIGVTSQYSKINVAGFCLDAFCQRCLAVATHAKTIAAHQTAEKVKSQEAFTAGLLHDVGQLVLIDHSAQQYQEVLAKQDATTTLWDAERETYGAAHPSIGAYILGQWGLPQAVVEAVGFHHHPDRIRHKDLLPVTAVHVAVAFERSFASGSFAWETKIDEDYLNATGHGGCLAAWEELATS